MTTHLINENDARSFLPCHREELAHQLLGLAHPFGDEVAAADGEEGAIRLGSHRLGEVRLAGAWRSVQQESAPRFTLAWCCHDRRCVASACGGDSESPSSWMCTCEELREFDGQDDGLLQRRFGRV